MLVIFDVWKDTIIISIHKDTNIVQKCLNFDICWKEVVFIFHKYIYF